MTELDLKRVAPVAKHLGAIGLEFLRHSSAAFERMMPHLEVGRWRRNNSSTLKFGAGWADGNVHKAIALRIAVPSAQGSQTWVAEAQRVRTPRSFKDVSTTLSASELQLCRVIAERASKLLGAHVAANDPSLLEWALTSFDEHVVASSLDAEHAHDGRTTRLFSALHELSEQTYENKSIPFGCLIRVRSRRTGAFPGKHFEQKKFKALSDGYHTAYAITAGGHLEGFVDLDATSTTLLHGQHFFPEWLRPLAVRSRNGQYGVALSRHGDIAIVQSSTLRLTYRGGRWQYWNHDFFVQLLHALARAQHVSREAVAATVNAIYRAALDLAFRRTGGLFVILRNRSRIREIARLGDTIGYKKREDISKELDAALPGKTVKGLPRSILVELASLDGAVVVDNRGALLAYGAVLRPRKTGRLGGTEGSRTKAAIGASHYGVAVKISSDGDTSVYFKGECFLHF